MNLREYLWKWKRKLGDSNPRYGYPYGSLANCEAEAGGFEPPVRLPVRQFSKLLVSATHPNFQNSKFRLRFLSNAVQI